MAYRGQFDRLIRAEERGQSILSTRTIAVFDDGLVVCEVGVYGDGPPPRGPFGGRPGKRAVRRGAGPGRGDERIREQAERASSAVAFAEMWPRALLVPEAVIDRVVLTRPRQVAELTIYEEADGPARSAFLGELSAGQVRAALSPLLGERLRIEVEE